jgi:hypothetical protein
VWNQVFDKLTLQWTDNGVTFDAGTDDTAEATKDPFSYKLRGLYFDGTNHLLTLDPTSNVYLHN